MSVTIHRDLTFTAAGRDYRVVGGATPEDTAQYGYEIEDIETGHREDGYSTLAEVREHVDHCLATGEPIVTVGIPEVSEWLTDRRRPRQGYTRRVHLYRPGAERSVCMRSIRPADAQTFDPERYVTESGHYRTACALCQQVEHGIASSIDPSDDDIQVSDIPEKAFDAISAMGDRPVGFVVTDALGTLGGVARFAVDTSRSSAPGVVPKVVSLFWYTAERVRFEEKV